MRITKQLLPLCLGFFMITAAPVSARLICERDAPPAGWKRVGALQNKKDCPTGKGYRIRKEQKQQPAQKQPQEKTVGPEKNENKKK